MNIQPQFAVYIIGGASQVILAGYLFIYYYLHSKRVVNGRGSRYFKDLSLVFLVPALLGIVWTINGIISVFGLREEFIVPFIMPITAISILLFVLTLGNFVRATNQE